MQLHTIEMDRAEARELYLEYRDAVRARHDDEMAEIMRGYKALAQGHQVIDLAATIRAGGTVSHTWRFWAGGDPKTMLLPALAVMRADQPWCRVAVGSAGEVVYHHAGHPRHNENRNLIRLPAGTIPDGHGDWSWRHRAMVPPVPPRLRPKAGLGNYHILWEAEWETTPPVDPALLRHIGGDLYAVLATWDLTDLERTVLTRRFR